MTDCTSIHYVNAIDKMAAYVYDFSFSYCLCLELGRSDMRPACRPAVEKERLFECSLIHRILYNWFLSVIVDIALRFTKETLENMKSCRNMRGRL